MPGRRRTDPLARTSLLLVAAGRITIGAGALLATRPALRALGFPDTDSSARALARLAGGRDIALGLLVLAARDDPGAMRSAALVGAGVDAADAVSLGLAAAHGEEIGRAGVVGALSGVAAAVVGIWGGLRVSA